MHEATLLFLLGQEHSHIMNRWSMLLLCIRCRVREMHRQISSQEHMNAKMLWMTLLTFFMSSQTCVVASPLRTADRPPQGPAQPSEAELEFAKYYLQRFYGYRPRADITKREADPRADVGVKVGLCDKVKEMQRNFGLPPSGELDDETLTAMKKPRCGLSDVEQFQGTSRWTERRISYRVAESGLPIPAPKARKVFRKAWKLWSSVIPLKFRKCEGEEVDIVISFQGGDHQDGSPFDGKKGILAHAFLPGSELGGDVHFDADEDWSFNATGFNLLAVAAHEFGHALGLFHSSDPGAIMFPAYNFASSYEVQLSFSDVKDVQRLYGINPNFNPLALKKPPPRTPDKCDPDLSFDAVSELQEEILFFKDRFMWRKHPDFTEIGISMINRLWPDTVPSYLDAAYENMERNAVFFFKGNRYWKLNQDKLAEGFPRNISDFGFPPEVKSVDAALHFRNQHHTVFFTGHECWRYNERRGAMEGAPVPISQLWPGIKPPIDAAIFFEGSVHFFKGNLHYKYDSEQVVSIHRANNLLECQKDSNETRSSRTEQRDFNQDW